MRDRLRQEEVINLEPAGFLLYKKHTNRLNRPAFLCHPPSWAPSFPASMNRFFLQSASVFKY